MTSDKWIVVLQALIVYAVVITKVGADCGANFTTIDITSVCSKSSCIGECRGDDVCCLEHCFQGSVGDIAVSYEECIVVEDTITCSHFENMTRCVADYLNKDFDVCWKQILYELTQIEGTFTEFNPLNCPCEGAFTRVDGTCNYLQCENSSNCETVQDAIRDIDVCCLHKDILPKYSDCGKQEKLDMSIHDYHNISTIVECQTTCVEGVCKMPDRSRLPACCRLSTKRQTDVVKEVDKLHGAVIAAIVIVVILLMIVCGFAVLYMCRTKLGGNIRQRMQPDREDASYEMNDVMKPIDKDNNKDIFDNFQAISCGSDDRTKPQEQQQHQHSTAGHISTYSVPVTLDSDNHTDPGVSNDPN